MEDFPGSNLDNEIHQEDDGLSLGDKASSVGSTDTDALAQRIAGAKRMLSLQTKPPPSAIHKLAESNHRKKKSTLNIFSNYSSSSDEDDMHRSFTARRPIHQRNEDVPRNVIAEASTAAVLDNISNTREEEERNTCSDDWSKMVDDDKNDGDDSEDTVALERRILERRRQHTGSIAPARKELPEEDEFVLPDDNDDSSSSSSNENNICYDKNSQLRSLEQSGFGSTPEDLTKRSPTIEIIQNVAANHYDPNQSNKARDSIIPPEVVAIKDIRQGLHRPSPRSRRCANRPAVSSALQDEIEDSSEDEGPIGRRSVGRKQLDSNYSRSVPRTLPPLAHHATTTAKPTKGKLVQQTLRFSLGAKQQRIGKKQKNASQLSPSRFLQASQQFHNTLDVPFDDKFSPTRTASPRRQTFHQQKLQQGSSAIDQDQSHGFVVNASAYEELPYQVHREKHHPLDQGRSPPYRHAAPPSTHQSQIIPSYEQARYPPIHHQQTNFHTHSNTNEQRSRAPIQAPQPYQNFRQEDQSCQDLQAHRYPPVANFQPVRNDPPHLLQHDQNRQTDFAITVSAYEDVQYRPFMPPAAPPALRKSQGRGRRIRDASARPKRKGWGGKRRKGGRKPTKSRPAAATTTTTFRLPPRDDHLSGVGGATLRF
jgi:hypothetical protein